MIDEKVIRRTFKDQFIVHLMMSRDVAQFRGFSVDGEVGRQTKQGSATEFYNSLESERLSQDRVQRA